MMVVGKRRGRGRCVSFQMDQQDDVTTNIARMHVIVHAGSRISWCIWQNQQHSSQLVF